MVFQHHRPVSAVLSARITSVTCGGELYLEQKVSQAPESCFKVLSSKAGTERGIYFLMFFIMLKHNFEAVILRVTQ